MPVETIISLDYTENVCVGESCPTAKLFSAVWESKKISLNNGCIYRAPSLPLRIFEGANAWSHIPNVPCRHAVPESVAGTFHLCTDLRQGFRRVLRKLGVISASLEIVSRKLKFGFDLAFRGEMRNSTRDGPTFSTWNKLQTGCFPLSRW